MTALELWLEQATRCLAKDSAAQVRAEIREHYESASETALSSGASAPEAGRSALASLGDPAAANRQYRAVLLTSSEARLLREGNWEAKAVCSRPWLKWTLLAVPAAITFTGAVWFAAGGNDIARTLVIGGTALGFMLAAPWLPVYTPTRSRIFRAVKWAALPAALVLAFGPKAWEYSWLLASSLWPLVWIEMTRASIRRKLPVTRWPKHLYL